MSEKDFSLPAEYDQAIVEQGEIIKKLQTECKLIVMILYIVLF